MKVLWICGLPRQVQTEALNGEDHGAYAEWSWILGHLPPPPEIELHIACGNRLILKPKTFHYRGAVFHLVPVRLRARILTLFQFDWIYFRQLAAEIKPDVTHGWGTEDAHALIAIRLNPRTHLVQIQGNVNAYRRRVSLPPRTLLTGLSERIALNQARHVVAENHYALESALPMVHTKSVHIVEHPVRQEFLLNRPSDGTARQVLYLGSIEERKGIWDALFAFNSGAPRDWKIAVAGNGSADSIKRLQHTIMKGGSHGRIRHYGQLGSADLIGLMQSSSVLLLPTRIDTGPTALKEALAMGLWPICYDNSGPGYYIRRFQFGDLAEDLDRNALVETLANALAAGKWNESDQQKKVKSRICPCFDPREIWPQLLSLYRKITTQEGGNR